MENQIEEIKKKVDIVEVIGSLVSLKKVGRNFKAICPFHQEKTPSFIVSPDRQIWRCFGACQEGGDVITFLMKWDGLTFSEALKKLADKAGVKLKHLEFTDKVWQKKEQLLKINHLAASYYRYLLHNSRLGEEALNYLKKRGVNLKIVEKFQLGYAPNSWNSLLSFLQKKGFNPVEINDAGLLVKNDRGHYYDRFRGRLMFPLADSQGLIVGFSGRSLNPQEKSAKYINTPETYLYHKRELIYGLHLAKEAIRKQNLAYVVEGEFDVISPYQYGIENIVAIKGAALTYEQLQLLKRYCRRIVLALDSDEAGLEAMKRGIAEAELLDLDLNIVTFTDAKDPDEAVHKDPLNFKKVLKHTLPVYDFLINLTFKKYSENSSYAKKQIANELVEFLQKIRNPIVKSHYIKKLAVLLDVTENSLESLLRKKAVKKTAPLILKQTIVKKQLEKRELMIEKYCLSAIFQSNDPFTLFKHFSQIIDEEDLWILSHRKLYQFLKDYQSSHSVYQIDEFVALLPAELKSVFDEVYLFATHYQQHDGRLDRLAYELKANSLKRQLKAILSQENGDNEETKQKIQHLNQALNRVEKTLAEL
jgi:DNA primase